MSDHQNHDHAPKLGEEKYWLDNPKNLELIWFALAGICVLFFFMGALYDFLTPMIGGGY